MNEELIPEDIIWSARPANPRYLNDVEKMFLHWLRLMNLEATPLERDENDNSCIVVLFKSFPTLLIHLLPNDSWIHLTIQLLHLSNQNNKKLSIFEVANEVLSTLPFPVKFLLRENGTLVSTTSLLMGQAHMDMEVFAEQLKGLIITTDIFLRRLEEAGISISTNRINEQIDACAQSYYV